MPHSKVTVPVPEQFIALMGRLERWTGRVSPRQAVSSILAIGLLLTLLALGLVYWAERHRQAQAFTVAVQRLQQQVQDQLDHERALSQQLADWASYQSFDGDRSTTWQSGGVSLIGPDALKLGLLSKLADLDEARTTQVERCLKQSLADRGAMLCRTQVGIRDPEQWFLITAVPMPGAGWVIRPLSALAQGWALDDGLYWRVQARLGQIGASPEVVGSDEPTLWSLDDPRTTARVSLGKGVLPLHVLGQTRSRTWADLWSSYSAMAIALAAGVLFTFGSLHLYLRLISTRRAAKDMAAEMTATLEHTQSRNQAVMDTAPDAIVLTDEQGRITWCNRATESIFGRDLKALKGRPAAEILPEFEGVDMSTWFNERGFSNRVIGHESSGRRAEGTAFPVSLSGTRATLQGETVQALFVRDTTDAKWAEQELLLRERALSSSADGVVITSMTLPNQPIIYVNHAFEQITGYESHEVLGMNCRLLQRDDRDQPEVHLLREAIAQGRSCEVVIRNYRKDGTMFYNELGVAPVRSPEGEVTHYIGVQTDITDRIAAEQVLALRTERLNAVFDLSPDGFVVFDKRGEVSIVNPAFERMTGLMAGDLVGQTLYGFDETLLARCSVSDIAERSVAAAIDGQGPGEGGHSQRRLLHIDAPQSRTLLQRVRHGGHDNETVMYFRDVTHELEVDRMKSEFLAMAAHELRTPMVSIFGFTELLLKRSFSDERRAEVLGTIHKQASILINLINELLDLARIEARRGKDFDRKLQPIGPVLEQALGGLKVPEDAQQVRLDLASPDTLVWADTNKLGQAVLNVLSNAYKYSPQGGVVALRQRYDASRQRVVIEIQDQGIGMSPEHVARVFERFFRADPSGNIPGTGLGMSLVKEIIDLHLGEVHITSTLGQGTTVHIEVPAQVANEMHTEPAPLDLLADMGSHPSVRGDADGNSARAKETTG